MDEPGTLTLFGREPVESPATTQTGRFVEVALEQAIDRVLDYRVPDRWPDPVLGQQVKAPLGRRNKPQIGYVVRIKPTSDHPKVKDLYSTHDVRVVVPPDLIELARWMGRYYVAPLGVVLDSVVPAAVKKRTGLHYRQVVRSNLPPEQLQTLFETIRGGKRKSILARLMQNDPGAPVDLLTLASEAGAKPATVRQLAKKGVLRIDAVPDLDAFGISGASVAPAAVSPQTLPEPNEDQQAALQDLIPRLSQGFGVTLLHGVTGSGKTEVYLRCIGEVVKSGKQAIVLVPEIALTPQTVRRFTERFPRVAVLHSGLTATDRNRYWQQIASGHADVVVGARSAVFAPTPKLGMIVVDEEHEPSYKQDTAPRYHGRDVAVKRAHIVGCQIILGSATPSLESYARATRTDGAGIASPYRLLSMPRRVRGLQMPHVETIDMRSEVRSRRGVHLLSVRLEHLMRACFDAKHQAILLLNRRGYSNFVYCPGCGEVVQCKYCDTTMTYHRTAGVSIEHPTTAQGVHTGQLHCHYCLAVNPLPSNCPACGKQLSLFGLGTQRVEEELVRKMPGVRFARVDSDSMRSGRDYEQTLKQFADREIDLLLGTQMIAKGLDFPNVSLVGVVSGDTALSLPDFRAAERTFQLITQVAGRAGRGDTPGRVILQTFVPEDPSIAFAAKHDFVGFAGSELVSREEVGLPPFSRMARIVIRDADQDKTHEHSQKLLELLADAQTTLGTNVLIRGPMPCAIARIAGYHRDQIVLSSPTVGPLQRLLAEVREKGGLARGERVAIDVDPVSLL